MRTLRLRVQLRHVRPDVVRVVDLPADATLDEVHVLLQAALGWTDSHLHEITAGDLRYGTPGPDEPWITDERRAQLADLPARWIYTYDTGDGWAHDVELLGPGGGDPGCAYGEGDCPPEDCGGWAGHEALRAAIASGDVDGTSIRPFDQGRADRLVRQVVGRVPDSVRMLLDLVGEGVTATRAGRLTRTTVREVQSRRPEWASDERPALRERDLPALAGLHDVLYSTGVLRMHRGKLVPLKAAGDDRVVLRRLRGWFDPEMFLGILAELAVATLLAEGPRTIDELARTLTPVFGSGASIGGLPLTEDEVFIGLNQVGGALTGLEQITRDRDGWHAGPDAGWVLPRTALLADRWTPR